MRNCSTSHFTAMVGYGYSTAELPPDGLNQKIGADLYVFVDGQLLFKRENFSGDDGPIELDIDLPTNARHLTLVTTDGGNTNRFDWVVLGDPKIHMNETPEPSKPAKNN